MKKYFFMAMLAMAVLSSCSKFDEFEQNQTGNQGLVFTATMEGIEGTRAKYNSEDKCVEWEEWDVISINGLPYRALTSGTTTTFVTGEMKAEGPTYKAYYPCDLFVYYLGPKANLPEIQKYTAGKFDMPMYAESTSTELHFKNLCAVLAIKVTSADINKLKSIKVASDKKMSGTFTVSDNKAVVGMDGTNGVVLESATALTLTEEGTVFYIAVPAQEYQYLNIFLSSDGYNYTQAMATKKADGIALERSKIYNIDYKKNATKLWKGSLFIADCNVGATSPTEYGGHYCWGGTIDNDPNKVHQSGSSPLSGDTDTATKLWGSNWRMPTEGELNKLSELGEWDATNRGLLCTSTDYSGNSVFLPVNDIPGFYWSSIPSSITSARVLRITDTDDYVESASYPERQQKNSVRAVLEEAKTPNFGKGKGWANDLQIYVNAIQLWEGGPKFAEYNIGVKDGKAESYGVYDVWGEKMYNSFYGTMTDCVEHDLTGDYLRYDNANKSWGAEWRMPTKAEFNALLVKCESEWTDSYNNSGVAGRIFTGRGDYSDNSIFLPAGGYYKSDDSPYDEYEPHDKTKSGSYWSSTYGDYEDAYYLTFNSNVQEINNAAAIPYKFSIRAVLAE